MSDSSNKAKSIFLAAIEGHSPEQWPAFLNEACGDDAALRGRVEQLLRARSALGSFHEAAEATIDQPTREGPGTIIGPYKLMEQIGEGSFGLVFVAAQREPVRRKVALKILKPGMDTRQVIARFEAERQALAVMDHPNIAKVFDGGATPSGRPYFVMELVKGSPITQFCDENRITPRQRLELFVDVCQAVQHAHQKGIIHRDLKPSNVLVTGNDGKPVVKVIDFGVAKGIGGLLSEMTVYTQRAQVIGTPLYMSPEQAGQSSQDIDTRSDIYSLGVLLYELLTGTTPFAKERFKQAAYDEMFRIIREEDPPRPSNRLSDSGDALASICAQRQTVPAKLTKLLRGEVDWIVMMCLEKDRTRRYESAAALAEDVQNFLDDKVVKARPPTAAYRVGKLARKHKAALGVGSAFLLLLMIGLAVSIWQAVLAQSERNLAQMALTRQIAERLDGEMRQLAVFGSAIEAAMAHQTNWNEDQQKEFLKDLLRSDDRIHGLTLAYEKGESPTNQQLYCLYVFRSLENPKVIKAKNLVPPNYPLYLNQPWYTEPLNTERPLWTGPTFDGATKEEKAWMVGYAVPVKRNKKVVGVVTVDVRTKHYTAYGSWLAELNLGSKSYGFIVDCTDAPDGKGKAGLFVSHPTFGAGDYENQSPGKITDLTVIDSNLAQRILKRDTGRETRIDPVTGTRLTILFHPVRSAGWSFVAVIEE